jgi:hypothetical protein
MGFWIVRAGGFTDILKELEILVNPPLHMGID